MQTIQEYPLAFNTQPQLFNIQGFDGILRVAENLSGNMSVWVSMDSSAPGQPAHMTFQMVEQGQPVSTLGNYIGSATIGPEVAGKREVHTMFVWSS